MDAARTSDATYKFTECSRESAHSGRSLVGNGASRSDSAPLAQLSPRDASAPAFVQGHLLVRLRLLVFDDIRQRQRVPVTGRTSAIRGFDFTRQPAARAALDDI